MRSSAPREKIDYMVYFESIPLLLRNPVVLLGPLLAAVLDSLLDIGLPGSDVPFGGLSGGIGSLIVLLLDTFGLALAIICADMVWRRGSASFDEAWTALKYKAKDIVFAALGLSFVVFLSAYIGNLFGPILMMALCTFTIGVFVYTVAAAAIGGVPGGMSLQASLDLARLRPWNTIILAAAFLLSYIFIGEILPIDYFGFATYGTMALVVGALCKAVAVGYAAMLMAKRYADIAYRGF